MSTSTITLTITDPRPLMRHYDDYLWTEQFRRDGAYVVGCLHLSGVLDADLERGGNTIVGKRLMTLEVFHGERGVEEVRWRQMPARITDYQLRRGTAPTLEAAKLEALRALASDYAEDDPEVKRLFDLLAYPGVDL